MIKLSELAVTANRRLSCDRNATRGLDRWRSVAISSLAAATPGRARRAVERQTKIVDTAFDDVRNAVEDRRVMTVIDVGNNLLPSKNVDLQDSDEQSFGKARRTGLAQTEDLNCQDRQTQLYE